MDVAVVRTDEGHRLRGEGPITELANRDLAHLVTRSWADHDDDRARRAQRQPSRSNVSVFQAEVCVQQFGRCVSEEVEMT